MTLSKGKELKPKFRIAFTRFKDSNKRGILYSVRHNGLYSEKKAKKILNKLHKNGEKYFAISQTGNKRLYARKGVKIETSKR